ncbi:hypothetical protein L209DRAFT_535527 [Thermothelomyces heterothallicus CBS 203.75]
MATLAPKVASGAFFSWNGVVTVFPTAVLRTSSSHGMEADPKNNSRRIMVTPCSIRFLRLVDAVWASFFFLERGARDCLFSRIGISYRCYWIKNERIACCAPDRGCGPVPASINPCQIHRELDPLPSIKPI